ANKVAKIGWSSATANTTARAKDSTVTLPDSLKVANTSVIWAEVTYGYTPTIGYVITGSIDLNDQIYMRPRLQDKICREGVVCAGRRPSGREPAARRQKRLALWTFRRPRDPPEARAFDRRRAACKRKRGHFILPFRQRQRERAVKNVACAER